jgi:hypothetical protein
LFACFHTVAAQKYSLDSFFHNYIRGSQPIGYEPLPCYTPRVYWFRLLKAVLAAGKNTASRYSNEAETPPMASVRCLPKPKGGVKRYIDTQKVPIYCELVMMQYCYVLRRKLTASFTPQARRRSSATTNRQPYLCPDIGLAWVQTSRAHLFKPEIIP